MSEKYVMIFAGTSEGRLLAEELCHAGIPCTVSVATAYGARLIPRENGIRVLTGRKSRGEMAAFLKCEPPVLAVDATHPFAVRASAELGGAAADAGVKCLRLARNTAGNDAGHLVSFADSFEEAAGRINEIDGNIFISTGSRDIGTLCRGIKDTKRLYVRVLPDAESLARCAAAGIQAGHVIAMQGPFSEALNAAMFRETGARAVLMKESGRTGGEDTKISAAEKLGIRSIIIRNPERAEAGGDPGRSFAEVLEAIRKCFQENTSALSDTETSGEHREAEKK